MNQSQEKQDGENYVTRTICVRMKEMLGEEYAAFYASYDLPKYQALRINPLKTERDTFFAAGTVFLNRVPWTTNGYYYSGNDQPGRHPYHEAGVYYIQEPSAMAPAEYLMAEPGERILDLCAAPGGKSTQIACSMQGEGLIVCNEIHPARAKILSENIERMGVCNALVTNETPQKLSDNFREYFDRILVDAPCSGEGMFRKNDAEREWSIEHVRSCAARQLLILNSAKDALKNGGYMVYSTCTFSKEENEGVISRFLTENPDFELVDSGVTFGRPTLDYARRIFPMDGGEGHFAAKLHKKGRAVFIII